MPQAGSQVTVLNATDQIQVDSCTEKKMIQRLRKDYACYQSTRRWTNSFSCCKRNTWKYHWASDWLKRYDKEGVGGLNDRTKSSGRPPEMSEEVSFSALLHDSKYS